MKVEIDVIPRPLKSEISCKICRTLMPVEVVEYMRVADGQFEIVNSRYVNKDWHHLDSYNICHECYGKIIAVFVPEDR